MNLHELKKVVNSAAKSILDQEKFPTGVLAIRVRKAAEEDPNDITLVAMSNFLAKRAEKDSLISRGELKSAYSKLYARNTKFAQLFSEELGISQETENKPAGFARHPEEGKSLLDSAYEHMADPVLANALSSILDKKSEVKLYSSKSSELAAKTCLAELNRYYPPRQIDVVAGQEDVIICKATYGTPKGPSSVLIPIEIKSGKALLPTVFLSQAGFTDLSEKTLREHVVATAGKSFRVDAQKFLEVVATAKNGPTKTLSEVEMIVARAKAAKGTPASQTKEGILYQEVDKPDLDVKTERSVESYVFAQKLASVSGGAEFLFGSTAVDAARKLVTQSLNQFGYKQAKVAVADHTQNSVHFAVNLDNQAGFKVPVKMDGNVAQMPKFVFASGSMYEFSPKGISSLLSDRSDVAMMAAASPVYGLKPSELVNRVQEAVLEGNKLQAEDALNVLQASDPEAYKVAFRIYLDGLSGKIKTASAAEESKCSSMRKVAHSKYMICGHTNLPVHKVYQDEHGNCQPLYRKNIAEAEGGSFLFSKVYLG